MDDNTNQVGHKLVIDNREYTEVTGVLHVESFDDEEVVLETELGLLALRGEELDIKELNLEEKLLQLNGLILEVAYSDDGGSTRGGSRSRGILGRIFR